MLQNGEIVDKAKEAAEAAEISLNRFIELAIIEKLEREAEK